MKSTRDKHAMTSNDFQMSTLAVRLDHLKKTWPSLKSEPSCGDMPLLLVCVTSNVRLITCRGCFQVTAAHLQIPFLDRDSLYKLDEEAKKLNSQTTTLDLKQQFLLTFVSHFPP